jgi:hypothetical protein
MRTRNVVAGIWLLTFVAIPSMHAEMQTGVRVLPAYYTSDLDNGVRFDYGTIPITVIVRSSRFSLRTTFPYVQMHAELPVIYVGGPLLRIPVGGQTIDEDGAGDVVMTPTVAIVTGDLHRPWVWAGARVKIPTADETKYLGTGKTDYGPVAGILQPIGTRVLFLASAAYIVRGDPPRVDLKNTLATSVACRVRAGLLSGVTLAVSRGDAANASLPPVWTASTSFDHFFRGGYSLFASAFAIRSDAGDGYGAAIGFTYHDDPLPWGS